MTQCIITDIEGTTTSIDFVFEVLFPYFRSQIATLDARSQEPEIAEILNQVKITVAAESGVQLDNAGAIEQLHQWSVEDRKIAPLKAIQGLIWQQGYEQGEFQSHVYADVPPILKEWQEQGLKLGVYSSGSDHAQKLLFGHTSYGDLTPYFSWFFDLKIGSKKETESYQAIIKAVNVPANEILFLSDVEAELDAADGAGLQTTQLVREGTRPSDRHRIVAKFDEIEVKL